MGLLGNIVSKVKSVVSDIKSVYKGGEVSASQGKIATGIINAAATIGQSFNPFSELKPSVNKEVVKSPTLQAVGNFAVKNPYTTTAIAVAPFTGAGKSLLSKAVSTTTGKVATGITAAAIIPAAATSSKVRTAIINTASTITPESIISTSANIGQAVQNPSKETIGDILKENKGTLLTAGAILTTIGATKLGAPILGGIIAANETDKNNPQPVTNTIIDKSGEVYKGIPTAAPVQPITPQTNTLSNSSQNIKRTKRRKSVAPLSVSQKVNVIVSQNQNKRYLNKLVVIN